MPWLTIIDKHHDLCLNENIARVVELADTLGSGSSAARCEGSNPSSRTIKINKLADASLFLFYIEISVHLLQTMLFRLSNLLRSPDK